MIKIKILEIMNQLPYNLLFFIFLRIWLKKIEFQMLKKKVLLIVC